MQSADHIHEMMPPGNRSHVLPSTAEINLKPWKYLGWSAFAQFAASDDDFLVLRRFDVASTRVLLAMQDNISFLEESLYQVDQACIDAANPDLNNGSFREEHGSDRSKIIADLRLALLEYKQFLWLHSELKSRPPACKQSRKNVETWLWNHPGAIVEAETKFLHANDLINLVERRRSPLRTFLESINGFRSCCLFKSNASQYNTDPQTITLYSDSRVDMFVTMLLLGFGLFMLICPIWVLNHVTNTHCRLAFISVAIVVFLLLVSVLTAARPCEAFAATAGYSAVLMVFLQIGSKA